MAVFNQARPDFEPYGFTCVRWTPTRMPRPDRHNEVELNLLQSGSLTYLLGGQRITIQAGRFAAFWAAIPHQILQARGNPEYFVVTLPLTWFLQCRLPETFVHRVLHGQVVCDPKATPETCDFQACERWAADLQSGGPDRQRAARLEIEARLLRLALSVPDGTSPPAEPRQRSLVLDPGGVSKAEAMAGFIAQHYPEPLTVANVARAVGLHPNYAMRLFQKAFGSTLVNYLTAHRVSHAQRLLATTDEKILAVALDSGFRSLSRFNEAFKQVCGCTPREYRQHHPLELDSASTGFSRPRRSSARRTIR